MRFERMGDGRIKFEELAIMMNSIEHPGDDKLRISLPPIACLGTAKFTFSAALYDDNVFQGFALILIDARVYIASIGPTSSKALIRKGIVFLLVDLET